MEGFPSGQRDQTVNLTAQPSKVRILPPPPLINDLRRVATSRCSHDRNDFALGKKGILVVVARRKLYCGYGSMVEPQPSKLMMRVRFPLPAPVFTESRVLVFGC